MRCKYCGAYIEENQYRCSACGREVQIVPDYNPLDDVVTQHVKGSLDRETDDLMQEEEERIREERKRRIADRRGEGRAQRGNYKTGDGKKVRKMSGTLNGRNHSAKQKKKAKQKKRIIKLSVLGIVLVMICVLSFFSYRNSYTGLIKRSEHLQSSGDYTQAETLLEKAIEKKPKKANAYQDLAKLYLAQGEKEKAESVFVNAIAEQKSNTELYDAFIQFYMEENEYGKIPTLIQSCEVASVKKYLENYIVEVPKFSLDDKKEYDDVQALELSSDENEICYTTDGTDPTVNSQKYSGIIKLEEGTTVVKAISVNKDGIPSEIVTKEYTVEFPIEQAPIVMPTTGQYNEEKQITITVPDNYTAYYTLDGSIPNPENVGTTFQYVEPIDMPEGNTIFSAVLVNQKGKISDVTKRSYELVLTDN